jgi:cellobiose dehydrogenase (acceptor)
LLFIADMVRSFVLSVALLALRAAAQTSSTYTDDKTGISFNGYTDPTTGYRLGLALPENPTTDFIAQIVAPVNLTGGGWGGFSMGQTMSGNLLVVAWPNGEEIVSSFRLAT